MTSTAGLDPPDRHFYECFPVAAPREGGVTCLALGGEDCLMVSLATRTEHSLKRWDCHVDGDELRGEMSVVVPVRSSGGSALMLKLLDRHAAAREAIALRAFPPVASVRCVDHAGDLGALLLERLTSESLASNVGHADELIVIQAQLARQLAVPDPGGMKWLSDNASWLAHQDEQRRQRPDLLSDRAALGACEAIMDLAQERTTTLTHGDLHAANVHKDAEGRWRALDPNPRVGTIAYESHTVIRDQLSEVVRAGEAELLRRLALFADAAEVDPQWSSRLCQARAVSSALYEHIRGNTALAEQLSWVAETLVDGHHH